MFVCGDALADKMLILKGIQYKLDVKSAEEFAKVKGYEPYTLAQSGENYANNPQYLAALKAINADPKITAIYGFSGGGYNTRRIFKSLRADKKKQIKRIEILGSPNVTKGDFPNVEKVNIIPNSPRGHMDTPRWYLEKTQKAKQ